MQLRKGRIDILWYYFYYYTEHSHTSKKELNKENIRIGYGRFHTTVHQIIISAPKMKNNYGAIKCWFWQYCDNNIDLSSFVLNKDSTLFFCFFFVISSFLVYNNYKYEPMIKTDTKKAKNCNYMGRIEKSYILISQYWYRDIGIYRFLGDQYYFIQLYKPCAVGAESFYWVLLFLWQFHGRIGRTKPIM